MSLKKNLWSEEEVQRLKDLYPHFTLSELSEKLGRTKCAVALKCSKLGLRGKGQPNAIKLTQEQKLWLKLNFPHMSNQICAWHLNISFRSVIRKARALGLVKTKQFIKEAQAHTAKKSEGESFEKWHLST